MDDERSGSYFVVSSTSDLVGIREILGIGAFVREIIDIRDSMSQLVEGGTTTKVKSFDTATRAERAGTLLFVERIAIVYITGRNDGIGDGSFLATADRVLAAHNPYGGILSCYGLEYGGSTRNRVGPEISLVKRIVATTTANIDRSG